MSNATDPFESLMAWWKNLLKQIKEKRMDESRELHKIEKQLSEEVEEYEQTKTHAISSVDIRSFWTIGIITVLLGYFIFQSLDILYLILAGFILAMATENVVTWLQKWFSRGFSILVTYLILLVFLFSGLVIVVPFVVQQMADIVNLLLDKVDILQTSLQENGLISVIETSFLPSQVKESLLGIIEGGNLMESAQTSIMENISQLVAVGSNYITNAGALAVSIVGGFFSAFVQVSIVFIVSIFFSIEKTSVIQFLARMSGRVQYTELKLKKLYRKLGFWLQGQLMLCVIVALMVGIGLTILSWLGIDIPNKFTLALIGGLTEFIPYVGPFMGMFPALLLGGLGYGWTGIVSVAILYRIIQQSENNILVPTVMSQTLGVSPLLIFLCMILGGSLFGILGIILAVPFAVIMNILFEDYKKEEKTVTQKKPRKVTKS